MGTLVHSQDLGVMHVSVVFFLICCKTSETKQWQMKSYENSELVVIGFDVKTIDLFNLFVNS